MQRLFGHNVLMVGAPGAGKTLLARALPGILPEMRIEESLDVTRIFSVADQLPPGTPLIRYRPLCRLQDEGGVLSMSKHQNLMRAAMSQLQLSARAYHCILKLARTITDLAGSETIQPPHLAEALQYRPKIMMG